MLLLAAIVSGAVATPQPVQPDRQARVSVLILRAELHRFQEIERSSPDRLRNVVVRSADGSIERVRVVEYM